MSRLVAGLLAGIPLLLMEPTLPAQQSWLEALDAENPALAYSTFAPDRYTALMDPAIAVDEHGNVHVAAYEYTQVFRDFWHFFLVNQALFTRLDAAGEAYSYTLRYLHARGTSAAADAEGNAYYTAILDRDAEFETTPGALNQPNGSGFVLKVSPTGEVLYAARISAQPEAIAVDSGGRAYLTGSAFADFTATAGSFKSEIGEIRCSEMYGLNPHACSDAFAARLSADGSRFEWATFFGGVQDESAIRIARDSAGAVYIAGETTSSDMATTAGAMQPEYGGGESLGPFNYGDGFLAKFSPDGSTLLYATYLGGLRGDFVTGLAISGDDSVVVTGTTQSGNFPVSENALQPDYGGGHEQPARSGDLFLAQFDASGAVLASTYLGGSLQEVSGPVLALPEGRLAVSMNDPQPDGPCGWGSRLVVLANGEVERVYELPQSLAPRGQPIAAGGTDAVYVAGYNTNAPPFGLTRNAASRQGTVLVTRLDLSDTSDITPGCVTNAASLRIGGQLGSPSVAIAPGEILSVFGRDLGPAEGVAAEFDENQRLPAALAGTRLLIDGRAIPLLYVSDRQINAIAPFDLSGETARVQIESEHGTTHEYEIAVAPALPGIFATGQNGSGQAAVVNQDGTLNSPGNRAPRGSIISIYATGLGRLTPTPADGSVVPLEAPFPTVTVGLQVYIAAPFQTGAAGMEILYAGAAPGLPAGVFQINARIPATARTGPNVPIRIVVDTTFERSQEAATIAVRE